MSFRILLTSTGGGLAPQAIRYLRRQSRHVDVFVVAVDSSNDALGRHFANAFEQVPHGTDPRFVEKLAEIAERYAVDLVVPWSDEEALAATRGRHLIEHGKRLLACADANVLAQLSDKTAAYAILQAAGLPVPRWVRAETIDQLGAAVQNLLDSGLDVAVKPAMSRGGRDVCVVRADVRGAEHYPGGREVHMDAATFHREYLSRYARLLPVMAMERLFEPTFDLDMLAWKGKLLRSVARRRRNSMVPNDGHILESRADLYDLAPRIVHAFNLSWLYDCDIMLDRDGRPRILEINPRPSGSTAVAVAAGIPLLDDLISVAKGEALPSVTLPYGRVVIPYTALMTGD